jgi:hypothetical protein
VPRYLGLKSTTPLPLHPASSFLYPLSSVVPSNPFLPPHGPRPHILPISLLLFSFTTLHTDFFAEIEKYAHAHGTFCSKQSFESSWRSRNIS